MRNLFYVSNSEKSFSQILFDSDCCEVVHNWIFCFKISSFTLPSLFFEIMIFIRIPSLKDIELFSLRNDNVITTRRISCFILLELIAEKILLNKFEFHQSRFEFSNSEINNYWVIIDENDALKNLLMVFVSKLFLFQYPGYVSRTYSFISN